MSSFVRYKCDKCNVTAIIEDDKIINFRVGRYKICRPCGNKIKNDADKIKKSNIRYETQQSIPISIPEIDTNVTPTVKYRNINKDELNKYFRDFLTNDLMLCGFSIKEMVEENSRNNLKLIETEYQRYKLYGDIKSDYEDMVVKHNNLCDKYKELLHENNINSLKIDKLENTVKELKDLLCKFIK